jgi:flagellar basal-body rod protein FlgB
MLGAKPNVIEVSGLKNKNDGNNVDMDREARLLAENALRFSVASNLAHSEITTIRTAIEEAGKV